MEPQKVISIEEVEEIIRKQAVVWFNGLGYCQMYLCLNDMKNAARFPWEQKKETKSGRI